MVAAPVAFGVAVLAGVVVTLGLGVGVLLGVGVGVGDPDPNDITRLNALTVPIPVAKSHPVFAV